MKGEKSSLYRGIHCNTALSIFQIEKKLEQVFRKVS